MDNNFSFSGDVFVIPNRVGTVGKLCEHVQRRVYELAEINKMPIGSEDVLIGLWFVGEETENLVDHGTMFGGKHRRAKCNLIPAKLLMGLHEGEMLKINLPCDNGDIIRCEVKAAQKKYRYRSFGSFEDAVNFCLR